LLVWRIRDPSEAEAVAPVPATQPAVSGGAVA
jgi:hypothetical protein